MSLPNSWFARTCLRLVAIMAIVAVTVGATSAKPNQAPSVGMTAPANGATFPAGAPITLSANATDSDGTVAKVEFFRGGTTLIGTVTASPYSLQWTNAAAGSYALTAKATDNLGATKTSSTVNIVVSATANNPPGVVLTSPINGATFTAPATVTMTASASDTDGTISKVEFYEGSSLRGTAVAAPYSMTWQGVAAGAYTLTAKAFDNLGATKTSAPIGITVGQANLPPLVVLTAPYPCVTYDAPASMLITADAVDPDGEIARVEFFQGSAQIGTATSSPYALTWTDVPPGTYTLTAKATDKQGATAISTPVIVIVQAANQPPLLQLTSPAEGATFGAPASIVLRADASDRDGTIAKVEFYNGGTLLGTSMTSPYTYSWSGVAAGNYTLTARAIDNRGATATCTAIHITVAANSPPAVSLSAPSEGATFNNPSSIALIATASDSDGSVAAVDFIVDGSTLASRNAPPYSFDWLNPPPGSHTIQARATDNRGASSVSAVAHITVNVAPVVTLNAPANGSAYAAPATIQLSATATTASGTLSGVEFYQGSTLIGSAATSPYAFTWSNVAAGSYVLTARAINSAGLSATSSASTVSVIPVAVTVSSPADGTTVYETNIVIKGTFTGLTPSGITVNGIAARLGTATFAAAVSLQPGVNPITIATTTAAGTLSQTFSVTRALPGVAITNLSDGQTIYDDTVTVMGTATAPPNSAVSVNGRLAMFAPDGRFFVNDVPLEPGANSLTVALNTPEVAAQQSALSSRAVRAKAEMPGQTFDLNRNGLAPFQMRVDPIEGFAPWTANIKLTNRLAYVYDTLDIDIDGDGQPDYSENGAPFPILERNFTVTYTNPGIYPITITLTRQGRSEIVYTATRAVHVMSPPTAANRLRTMVDQMLNRLAANDITRASQFFTNTIRQRYSDAFTLLGPTLMSFVESVGEFESVTMGEDYAEIFILRPAEGGPLRFSVLLIRDEDGIWRIDGM